MAPFNRILSLSDVHQRCQQFETQLKKLESDSEARNQSKATIVRRVVDLLKQLDDYLKKVQGIPVKSIDQQEQKQVLLKTLGKFKERAESLCGGVEIKSRPTSASSSTTPRTQKFEQSEGEMASERPKSGGGGGGMRRASLMYNQEESSTDEEEEEEPPKLSTVEEMRSRVERQKEKKTQRNEVREWNAFPYSVIQNLIEYMPNRVFEVISEVIMPVPQKSMSQAMSDEEIDDSQEEEEDEEEDQEDRDRKPKDETKTDAKPASIATPSNRQTEQDIVVEGNRFLILADWNAEQPTDLSIKKGDLLKVIETRADGWWKAVNTMGSEGMVPKTFLKHFDPNQSSPHEHLQQPIQQRRIQQETMAEQRFEQPPPAFAQTFSHQPPPIRGNPIEIETTATVRCLGEALARDSHLTAACHLAPRLSESNLAFHDLYWNFKDDKLRKRFVRISKLIRIIRVEGMESRQNAQANLLRIAIFDLSKRTGRQIVSNVHTICANNQSGNWGFSSKIDSTMDVFHFSDLIIRSNYQQADIVLVIEASVIQTDQSGYAREISLGVAKLPLLSDQGTVRLANRTYAEILIRENLFDRSTTGIKTNFRLVMKVMDVPSDLVQYVDSLPDILLLQPPFARFAFFYRRRLAEALIRDKEDPVSSELLYDPFLASFPRAFDQPDLLDYCRKTFQHKYKQIAKRSEAEQAAEFYSYFMTTVFVLIDTSMMPPFSAWDPRIIQARRSMMDKHTASVLEHKGNVQFLLSNPCRPLDIFAYAVDLTGEHAID